jgi:uncharacterized membrane protein YfcA
MTWEALHGGIGWAPAGALIALSFATSFIAAAFGLGGGAIMLAALATLLPAAAIIPVHGVVQLGSNAGRAAIMLKHFPGGVLLPFLAGSAAGVALGGSVLTQLSPAVIKMGVGAFILYSLAAKPPRALARSAGIAGAVSSFLTMFFGATGPFVAAFVRSLALERHAHVATHSVLMAAQHLLKSLAFGLLGFAFGQWLPLLAGLILSGFLGTLGGRSVLTRIDERRFRLILNAILVALGLNLLVAGAQEQFGLTLLPSFGGATG